MPDRVTMNEVLHLAGRVERITADELFEAIDRDEPGDGAALHTLPVSLQERLFIAIVFAVQRAKEESEGLKR